MTAADIERITSRLFLSRGDRARNLSAFWILLVLAAVIASAGVVADSTATVIGAMIVAPLMTPILGTALAIVMADKRQLLWNLGLVLTASAAVVVVGFLLGLSVQLDVVSATNSQVASRVSPRLIDLVAAIATGCVGTFALIRSDVSDALPGVAIAISLVPPLAVVGLTLESGAPDEALGALLLFGTNVAAIIATGVAVLMVAGLRRTAREGGYPVGKLEGRSLAAVAASLAIVAVPLGVGSASVVREQALIARARPIADAWATAQGWTITDVFVRRGTLHIVSLGGPPEADPADLRQAFDEGGMPGVDVVVSLVVGGSRTLPGD